MNDLDNLKKQLLGFMKKAYGNIFCFEHGAVSNVCRAGSCIDHAHLHLCPCPVEIESNIDARFEKKYLTSMTELARFSKEDIPYIYYENQNGLKMAYLLPSHVESQYMRRLWASALGKPDEWDWAVFVGYENVLKTLQLFGKR